MNSKKENLSLSLYKSSIKKEIWIAGFPSRYGGADTELDHQIDIWRKYGVDVFLVPMFGSEPEMEESVKKRGCHIFRYQDDIFKDKIVASWCNGQFLDKLPLIMEYGKPKKVIWFNCMTWLFEKEREAHKNGWIDIFGFVSNFQKSMLFPQLQRINKEVNTFDYIPYFNYDRIKWEVKDIKDYYRVGRISRDDPAKFSEDTWKIFDDIKTPNGIGKKVYVLGFSDKIKEKIGDPPLRMDYMWWTPNAIPVEQFYNIINTVVHKTGGSRESYCRIVFECYAYGVIPIVENDFAFPTLIRHGETGFLCNNSDEMSYYASELAFNTDKYKRMVLNGINFLKESNKPEICWKGWAEIL